MNCVSRTKSLTTLALVIAAFANPADVRAQQSATTSGGWRVEPTVGIWRQHDRGPATDRRVGQFVGLGLSRQAGTRAHLTTSLGYYRLGDALELQTTAQGQSRTEIYDSELIPISAGVAADLWRSDAAALAVGLELGAVWARDRLARSTGPEPLTGVPQDDWTPSFLAAPSLGLRQAIGPRVDLTATGRLLLGFGDYSPNTIPTLALGLAYQF